MHSRGVHCGCEGVVIVYFETSEDGGPWVAVRKVGGFQY
jgi:hypothetical protein